MFRTIDTSISASCLILWHTQAKHILYVIGNQETDDLLSFGRV